MSGYDFPVAVRAWPIQEKDITEDVCKTCGICCEIEIKTSWPDVRRFEWLRAIVENHDSIETIDKGIRIRCSHLKPTKHATDPHWECDIYETRPQLCRDFNCVSWAKVTDDLTQYDKVLKKMGITTSPFSEELRGPDI